MQKYKKICKYAKKRQKYLHISEKSSTFVVEKSALEGSVSSQMGGFDIFK